MSGIRIPGIEILEKVGAGGMATVWKARQISLNRTVAVKILYSKFSSDPADVLRFQHEAQAAACLKHQGIVQVYDANVVDGIYFFTMEFVAGYTVAEWVRRSGRLPVKDALLVAECVAEALRYAWNEAGIMHCDVKPDNILVDADGTVKVSDLGLARTLSQMRQDSESDEIMGTPAYMSPEQILGDGEVDFRSDIYALGATLYQMVTGKTPFGDQPPDAVMDLQVNGTLPDPIELSPKLPAPVCWLIEKMMCKDPAGRQESWEAVIRDLGRVKKGLRPLGDALPAGVSTVARSAARIKGFRLPAHVGASRKRGTVASLLRLVLVLALAGGGLFLFRQFKSGHLQQAMGTGTMGGNRAADAEAQAAAAHWQADYQQAVAWADEHPGQWDEAVTMLARIAQGATGTPYAAMARGRVDALQADKQARIATMMDLLKQQADALSAEKRWEEAAQIYAAYTGALAHETEALRATRADELRAQQATAPPQRSLDAVMAAAAQQMLTGKLETAVTILDEAIADPAHDADVDALNAVRVEVAGAWDLAGRVMASFDAQKGRSVQVELRTGVRQLRIKDVLDGHIVAEIVGNAANSPMQGTVEFDANSLSTREHLRRMGGVNQNQAGSQLYAGLMAREAGATDFAARYFAQTPEPLATFLLSGAAPARP